MRKTFTLNTEPHVAEIVSADGTTEVLFRPEVMGDEYVDAHMRLQTRAEELGVDLGAMTNLTPAQSVALTGELRVFLASLMLPESADVFARWDVIGARKKVISSHQDPQEAQKVAAGQKGTIVKDASLRLPDRVLVALLEWAIELYGGGERPTTSSSDSAAASPPAGTPGRAPSRSRASMSTRGR